jgi:hypothetical protein
VIDVGVGFDGAEKVACIDAIARGFANGMTFSDITRGWLTGAREPEGGGAIRRAITGAASAVVFSSESNDRGTCGIARLFGSIRGRDFLGCMSSGALVVQNHRHHKVIATYVIALLCA